MDDEKTHGLRLRKPSPRFKFYGDRDISFSRLRASPYEALEIASRSEGPLHISYFGNHVLVIQDAWVYSLMLERYLKSVSPDKDLDNATAIRLLKDFQRA